MMRLNNLQRSGRSEIQTGPCGSVLSTTAFQSITLATTVHHYDSQWEREDAELRLRIRNNSSKLKM